MIKNLILETQEIIKEGTSASGKDWILYSYDCAGKKYTGFNDYSHWFGKEMAYEVEQREGKLNTKTNKPFINWSITGMATTDAQPQPSKASERFDEIDEKLEAIYLAIQDLKTEWENKEISKNPL